jgi:hypothetical protein
MLGAAGTAANVVRQNIYNTRIRMACAGIFKEDIDQALAQQIAFFDALRDRSKIPALDRLTRAARVNVAIAEWIFPGSEGLNVPDAWFTVLDPNFDPLPIWRSYNGRPAFVFSEFDDATDTAWTLHRLAQSNMKSVKLNSAQHLGLMATDKCHVDLTEVSRFNPRLFRTLATFARGE